MRHSIAQHDPSLVAVRDVNGFVVAEAALAEDGHGAVAGLIAEDAAGSAGRVLRAAESKKEEGAKKDPPDVDCREPRTSRV